MSDADFNTTASLLAGFKDTCPPWPCHPAKASMELWVQVPQAAWMGLLLWIPQLKETNTLLLVLGEKGEALFGHQVYALSLRSCSFIKPSLPTSRRWEGCRAWLLWALRSFPFRKIFPVSLLPHGWLLASPLFMLEYRSGVGGWGKSFTAHIKNKNCSQADLLPDI